MAQEQSDQEARILAMVKQVLTAVAKETFVRPGYKHPLTENTIMGIRDCLALVSSREHELGADTQGMRPRYADEPNKAVVIALDKTGLGKKTSGDTQD